MNSPRHLSRTAHCVSRHEARETITGQAFLQEILYYFIELPKFTKTLENLTGVLDQWIWFIKFAGTMEGVPDQIRTEPIRHAFEKARVANMTKEEHEYYDKAGIAIQDARGALTVARQEGFLIGEQKGRQEGRQEGLRDGETRSLLRLVERRFQSVPEWVHSKLANADLEAIRRWMENILEAKSIDDVFL
ncbi:MAG: PD-(D/E)XK nuclease family transposase [Magnetococcales bacterium]|nr:PD-(D/E)XK nuclease family transposase [Magnetococcales bacterium]